MVDRYMTAVAPSTRLVWRVWIAIVVLSVLIAYGGYTSMVSHMRLRGRVEQRIGAQIGSPYVKAGGDFREIIAFVHVQPEGTAANCGIGEADILVDRISIHGLCQRLDAPAGTEVVVNVIPGGDGLALSERPVRNVVIVLP